MGDTYPFNDNKYAKKAPIRPDTAEPLDRILHKIRKVCEKRGSSGFQCLSRTFRLYDSDRSNDLDKEEVGVGLSKYGIQLSEEELETIFAAFDVDGSGTVNLTELLRCIKSPMSNARIALVQKAFQKMDKTGDGVIKQDDVKGVYNVKDHPKFKTGQWTEEQCFQEFLNGFQENSETKDDKHTPRKQKVPKAKCSEASPQEVVTWEEFLDYYTGVSAGIDKEVYFDYMMRQTWKI